MGIDTGYLFKGGSPSGFTTTLSLEINFQYFGKFRKKTGIFLEIFQNRKIHKIFWNILENSKIFVFWNMLKFFTKNVFFF